MLVRCPYAGGWPGGWWEGGRERADGRVGPRRSGDLERKERKDPKTFSDA